MYAEYEGLIRGQKAPAEVIMASRIYDGQRTRCTNPRSQKFHRYGLRGIQVKYSKRQFVTWFLENLRTYDRSQRLSVGRIDHDLSYEFGNIKIEPYSENSRERMRRMPNPCKKKVIPIRIIDEETNTEFAVVRTTREAAALTGASKSAVFYQVKHPKAAKSRQLKFRFEYAI